MFEKMSAECTDGLKADSCLTVGALLMSDPEGERNIERAGHALKIACNARFEDSCHFYGLWFLAHDNPNRDQNAAFDLLAAECDAGAPPAVCSDAASALVNSKAPGDSAKVYVYSRKACDGDDMDGCAMAGLLLATGDGVKEDDVAAVPLMEKACTMGDGASCAALALAYNKGEGVRRDLKKRDAYAKRSCDLGFEYLCGK